MFAKSFVVNIPFFFQYVVLHVSFHKKITMSEEIKTVPTWPNAMATKDEISKRNWERFGTLGIVYYYVICFFRSLLYLEIQVISIWFFCWKYTKTPSSFMITIEYYRIFMAWDPIGFITIHHRFGRKTTASFFQVEDLPFNSLWSDPFGHPCFFTVCNRNGILHDATSMYINPSINPTPGIISSQRKLQDIQVENWLGLAFTAPNCCSFLCSGIRMDHRPTRWVLVCHDFSWRKRLGSCFSS